MEQEKQATEVQKKTYKTKLTALASMRFNTGNYEWIDVSKSMDLEVEFSNPEELAKKSAKLDKLVADLIKAEIEMLMRETNRTRCALINGKTTPIALWESL